MSTDLAYSDSKSFFVDSNRIEPEMGDDSGRFLVNRDSHFSFPTQGDGFNPMVDACENLIALSIRIKSLKSLDSVDALHESVIKEVEKVELILRNSGKYDDAALLTCRYCLCTVLDEAVLNTNWGKDSLWSSHSLLSTFHGETWGGEKFYKIINRLLESPEDYIDLLGLLYIFLCLGYQGRYGLSDDGEKERRAIIEKIYPLFRVDQKEVREFNLDMGEQHTVAQGYILKLEIPSWVIYLFGFSMLICLYLLFDHYLDIEIENVLLKLKKFIN